MAWKLNGAIDYQSTPISNGLLLLGAFPFDVRVSAVRLKTKWLYWYKGVCCADAYIQQRWGGKEATIVFTENNMDSGNPLPPQASPDIFIEPFHGGTYATIAINDTNDFFNYSKEYGEEIPF